MAFLSTKMIDSLVMLCSPEIVADRDERFALSKILCIFESSMECEIVRLRSARISAASRLREMVAFKSESISALKRFFPMLALRSLMMSEAKRLLGMVALRSASMPEASMDLEMDPGARLTEPALRA